MASVFGVPLVCLVFALTTIRGIHAIQYKVTYFAKGEGGSIFKEKIGDAAAISIMEDATKFVWEEVLDQLSPNERKPVKKIDLVIDVDEQMRGDPSSYKKEGIDSDQAYSIHLNSAFIRMCPADRLQIRVTRMIYYEIARILQWANDDQKMKKAIAFFTLFERKIGSKKWVRFGEGEKWDSDSKVTAQFLIYCNLRQPGFVSFLNKKMKTSSFGTKFFEEYLHKNVEFLWENYKENFGNDKA